MEKSSYLRFNLYPYFLNSTVDFRLKFFVDKLPLLNAEISVGECTDTRVKVGGWGPPNTPFCYFFVAFFVKTRARSYCIGNGLSVIQTDMFLFSFTFWYVLVVGIIQVRLSLINFFQYSFYFV